MWARADQKVLEVGMVGSWKSVGWGVGGATALEEVPPPSKSRANDHPGAPLWGERDGS